MIIYLGIANSSISALKETKRRNDNHVRMFQNQFGIEFCNSVCSILSIMCRYNGTLNLNRIGSNPVEHVFGLVRMKSRNINTFEKMKKALGKAELHKKMKKELGIGVPIRSRTSYYGRKINNQIESFTDVFEGNPRDIAMSIAIEMGLPVSLRELNVWDINSIFMISHEIFSNFMSNIRNVRNRIHPSTKHRLYSSSLKITKGKNIINRIMDKTVVK